MDSKEVGVVVDGASHNPAAALYTVEALLHKAGVVGQQKIFSKINEIVRVKGVATKVRPYSKAAYMVLVDRDFQVNVKYDPSQPVTEGQHVVVEGLLLLKPSNFFTGLECLIDGNVVGGWHTVGLRQQAAHPALEKHRFLRLDDFVAEHGISDILVLGTETALSDVLSLVDDSVACNLQTQVIRVGRKDALIGDVQAAISPTVKAMALVRGGDDKTMDVWDDPEVVSFLLECGIPFYTGLGHSHLSTLADRYADSSFHTPGALGMALNAVVERRRYVTSLIESCKSLKEEKQQLSEKMAVLSHQVIADESRKGVHTVRIGAIVVCVALMAAIFFGYLHAVQS